VTSRSARGRPPAAHRAVFRLGQRCPADGPCHAASLMGRATCSRSVYEFTRDSRSDLTAPDHRTRDARSRVPCSATGSTGQPRNLRLSLLSGDHARSPCPDRTRRRNPCNACAAPRGGRLGRIRSTVAPRKRGLVDACRRACSRSPPLVQSDPYDVSSLRPCMIHICRRVM
jgi:hypothetical protein